MTPTGEGEAGAGPVRRIVVAGGGTAGWMAAIYLNRFMRGVKGSVVLVESPAIGTIGVGEATVPSIVHFLRQMNLDEAALMRRCSATFKLGIRFENWVQEGGAYWHPFGVCGARMKGVDLFHYWNRRRRETGGSLAYSAYSLQARLAEKELAPWPYGRGSSILETGAYALHLDAAALADHLREIATKEGVEHLRGDIGHVALDEGGAIASLDLGDGRCVRGDLFIDATGFHGRLIEQALGDRWIDWSGHMLCDRAVTCALPPSPTFPPYTRSRALEAGWRWSIPLTHRTGSGYVHSSAHVSLEEATRRLLADAGEPEARAGDVRALNFRVGRRTHFWLRNYISVGLSSGFVEPLESTGIHLIQKAVERIVDHFPDLGFAAPLRRAYNEAMARDYDEIRDFIQLHYLLTRRQEPFWRDSRHAPISDTLRERLALYDEAGRIDIPASHLFPDTSYYFILTGNDRLPRRSILEAQSEAAAQVWPILDSIRAKASETIVRMPGHRDYLARLHGLAP